MEEAKLQNAFWWTEWIVHTSVVYVFGCTGFFIVPFIQCYTKGIVVSLSAMVAFLSAIIALSSFLAFISPAAYEVASCSRYLRRPSISSFA